MQASILITVNIARLIAGLLPVDEYSYSYKNKNLDRVRKTLASFKDEPVCVVGTNPVG
jgi:hypothetical protein